MTKELVKTATIYDYLDMFCGIDGLEIIDTITLKGVSIQKHPECKTAYQILHANKVIGNIAANSIKNNRFELYFNSKGQLYGIEIDGYRSGFCIRNQKNFEKR